MTTLRRILRRLVPAYLSLTSLRAIESWIQNYVVFPPVSTYFCSSALSNSVEIFCPVCLYIPFNSLLLSLKFLCHLLTCRSLQPILPLGLRIETNHLELTSQHFRIQFKTTSFF